MGTVKHMLKIEDVYGGVSVEKKECVGHVQKPAGTALRKLKKKENNDIGGKGKLILIVSSINFRITVE